MTTGRRRASRGGQGGWEPRLRIRRREQEVIRLATEGHSQREIAQSVGITQPAVSQIIRRYDERWLQENEDRIERFKAQQHRQLEHVVRESLRAWDASKAERTRKRQRKTDGGANGGAGTVAEIIVDDSHGDPRYLEAARRALADLARLWGDATSHEAEIPTEFTLTLGDERTAPHRPTTTRDDHA